MAALLGVALIASVACQDILDAAALAHVDPVDLAGAVNTTGLEPLKYLYTTGELEPPKPAIQDVWYRLAQCESTGRWAANTGNGYLGGLQMDMTFWRRYGGLSYAARPDLASVSAQVAVAEHGLASQGWGAWPACSRRLGLR